MNPPQASSIALLLADVDGTLVTKDKVLTERARAAVHKLHEAGIAFAITSGRPPLGMKMLIEPLALITPVAGFNGGLFVQPGDLSIIEQRVLPPDIARRSVQLIAEHNLDVWVYSGNQWYVRDPKAPHVEREAWTVKFEPTVVENFDNLLETVAKVVGVSDDFDLVARTENDARYTFGPGDVSAARSQPYYLDITHPLANKGAVVEWLSARLAIPTSAIATIGDMPNDVLMFAKSGLSIAMGNASPEVQRTARYVTDTNENEGFAGAVERYVLAPQAVSSTGEK